MSNDQGQLKLNGYKGDLEGQVWQDAVVGSGLTAFWSYLFLRNQGRRVIWICTDSVPTEAEASFRYGWNWVVSKDMGEVLNRCVSSEASVAKSGEESNGVESPEHTHEHEHEPEPEQSSWFYFDAKNSKRLRNPTELKIHWGEHEKSFFLGSQWNAAGVSIQNKHQQIWQREAAVVHVPEGAVLYQNQAVIARSHLLLHFSLAGVTGQPADAKQATLNGLEFVMQNGGKPQAVSVRFERAILADLNGQWHSSWSSLLPSQVLDQCAPLLNQYRKGRNVFPGYSLMFHHKTPVGENPWGFDGWQVLPLVANPKDKSQMSHIAGRFFQENDSWVSVWFGFLTEEELEDNQEILSKIRATRRAVERSVTAVEGTIEKEVFSFEPQMCAQMAKTQTTLKKTAGHALGALLVTDVFGSAGALYGLQSVVEATSGEKFVLAPLDALYLFEASAESSLKLHKTRGGNKQSPKANEVPSPVLPKS